MSECLYKCSKRVRDSGSKFRYGNPLRQVLIKASLKTVETYDDFEYNDGEEGLRTRKRVFINNSRMIHGP